MKTAHDILFRADCGLRPYERYMTRNVSPFKPATEQEEALMNKAAARVRAAYLKGIRRVASNNGDPTPFMDACADTTFAVFELGNVIEDDSLLSVAWGICERAGVLGGDVKPTSLEAQARMQIEAVDGAQRIKFLLARQQALGV